MASLHACTPSPVLSPLSPRHVLVPCAFLSCPLPPTSTPATSCRSISYSSRIAGQPLAYHKAPRGARGLAFPDHSRSPLVRPLASLPSDTSSATSPDKPGTPTPDTPGTASAAQQQNGASSSGKPGEGAGTEDKPPLPLGEPEFSPLQGLGKLAAQTKMLLALPWTRVKKGSVLSIRFSGGISEQVVGFGGARGVLALPTLLDNLEKAAVDPRVAGLLVRIDSLGAGWGKVDEIRRYIRLFRKSGKPSIAYMQVVGEMEYYLATAFEEIYIPPSAYVSLRGLAVQGAFLGGVLEKVGVQPQVQRIGKYKSAGDQFMRKDMSEANREMLTALLDDIYFNWISGISAARGKTVEEIQALLDSGIIKAETLLENGLVTGLMYEREVESMLKERLGQMKNPEKDKDKPLRRVEYRKYSRVWKSTLNLGGSKDALVAVLRASGGITQGRDRGTGGGVKSDSFIDRIRFVRESKQFKAVVLRIDSPGGDALASDLMWHELRELAKVKPLVASMSDVAASGGYYMAMAAPVIVAEHLTLTGSIGVVLAKLNLGELYKRIGFNREILSRGKYAQLNADNRPFTPEEETFFAAGAESAYESFRNKAALSRSLEVEAMEAVAQGRVWTGNQAFQRGLVDAVGGISRAIAIAKEKAGIPAGKRVKTVELSVSTPSITALLSGARVLGEVLGLHGEAVQRSAIAQVLMQPAGLTGLASETSMLLNSPPGTPHALMPEIEITGISQLGNSAHLHSLQGDLLGGGEGAQVSSLPLLLLRGLLASRSES